MNGPLLITKTRVPVAHVRPVLRPRLMARLTGGEGARLTLLAAPAGFGKTTLLATWARYCGHAVGWLALDQADNDPARFLAYLDAALAPLFALPEHAHALTRAASPGFNEGQLTELLNHMALLDDDLSLVLDDYHVITSQAIHDMVAFLLAHLPDRAHLVIATRSDPPLPLAQLRARGQLTELRQADLRFTLAEADEFLTNLMGLPLSAHDVAVLETRTEGWAAGLQLAGVSLRGREDTSGLIQSFAGSNRYVLDYLVAEVLAQQSEAVQGFLLDTCILDRLAGTLCDALTGKDDGQQSLESLEHANLFLIPLDDERRWYRYHHLFADCLRARLQQCEPERLPLLHRRAAHWFQCHGHAAEAIGHALAASDVEWAASLVERNAAHVLMRGEIATFIEWVEALPTQTLDAHPSLALLQAWALLISGHSLRTVEPYLRKLEQRPDLPPGQVSTLYAPLVALQGHVARAAELCGRALKDLEPDDEFLRGLAMWNLGLAHAMGGNWTAAEQAFNDAAQLGQETGNAMVAVIALCNLAELRLAQGRLHAAMELYQQALAAGTDEHLERLPVSAQALIGLGELQREWNDLEGASRYVQEGLDVAQGWGQLGALDGYLALARIRQAQGDWAGADAALRAARDVAAEFDVTEIDDIGVADMAARLRIARGDTAAATRWVQERGLETTLQSTEPLCDDRRETRLASQVRAFEYVTLARLFIAQNKSREALALLEPLVAAAEQLTFYRALIEIELLRALAYRALGDSPRALQALSHALALAEPEGFVRAFVDEGSALAQLLHQAASHGIAREYVGRLLAAFPAEKPSAALSSPKLVEPLSERELQVLRLIAAGLTNQEIAGRLCLSLRTVKWHAGNIYGKLGVQNRTAATVVARALGLLQES